MLRKLMSLFSVKVKKPDREEKETKGAETRRTLTPEQAYRIRKRMAKKHRKAQKKSKRRNRK